MIVAVGVNVSKHRLFTAEERIAMLEQGDRGLGNVRVEGFTGLLTTYCQRARGARDRQGAARGDRLRLRAADGPDERHLTGVETVFVPTSPEYGFVPRSSLVKEVASYGGDVSGLVPDFVLGPLTEKLAQRTAE